MKWTLKNQTLVSSDETFLYEATLEKGGFVFFRSYNMGEHWSVIGFNELPFQLQEHLKKITSQ